MSRILVIGGYGGFGARLSRRLVGSGHAVLVGGRSAEKAARFCATLPGSESIETDRTGDLGPILRKVNPDILIDAAGPFQACCYGVPKACIDAGVHYLDLADARDFVVGIGELDGAAAKAGVAVISGASTVPALSSAVAVELARGLDRVEKVDIALSAATHSTANFSVAKAVLSYLGRPIKLPCGSTFGWQSLKRRRYKMSGATPLRRLVAIVDVPDYDLLPSSLPGNPGVEFRAGTDVSFHMIALWLASWMVRWTGFKLDKFASAFVKLQRLTALGRGDRSAMDVRLIGVRGTEHLDRRWTLIAEDFDGPEIPTMAAALLADDIAAGKIGPGARPAAGLLSLDRFEVCFAKLAIRLEMVASMIDSTEEARDVLVLGN
nr:hypothetical protein [Sphingomonas sp.]